MKTAMKRSRLLSWLAAGLLVLPVLVSVAAGQIPESLTLKPGDRHLLSFDGDLKTIQSNNTAVGVQVMGERSTRLTAGRQEGAAEVTYELLDGRRGVVRVTVGADLEQVLRDVQRELGNIVGVSAEIDAGNGRVVVSGRIVTLRDLGAYSAGRKSLLERYAPSLLHFQPMPEPDWAPFVEQLTGRLQSRPGILLPVVAHRDGEFELRGVVREAQAGELYRREVQQALTAIDVTMPLVDLFKTEAQVCEDLEAVLNARRDVGNARVALRCPPTQPRRLLLSATVVGDGKVALETLENELGETLLAYIETGLGLQREQAVVDSVNVLTPQRIAEVFEDALAERGIIVPKVGVIFLGGALQVHLQGDAPNEQALKATTTIAERALAQLGIVDATVINEIKISDHTIELEVIRFSFDETLQRDIGTDLLRDLGVTVQATVDMSNMDNWRPEWNVSTTLNLAKVFNFFSGNGYAVSFERQVVATKNGTVGRAKVGGEVIITVEGEGAMVEKIPTGTDVTFTPTLMSGDKVQLNMEIVVRTYGGRDPQSGDRPVAEVLSQSTQDIPLGHWAMTAMNNLKMKDEDTGGVPWIQKIPVLNWFTSRKRLGYKDVTVGVIVIPRLGATTLMAAESESARTEAILARIQERLGSKGKTYKEE